MSTIFGVQTKIIYFENVSIFTHADGHMDFTQTDKQTLNYCVTILLIMVSL